MKFAAASLLACFASLQTSAAQDPASGWMAYAVGDISSTGAERITRLEMTWTVGAEPKASSAFFSPWFGMDPDDNLNLIQPVNPWSGGVFRGGSWSAYTEYYQWSPTHNSNSDSFNVKSGDTLHGSLVWDESTDSYTLTQECLETGQSSSQVVKAQNGKKYTIPYVVYEKTFPCADYPPDEIVTFHDIIMECDGKDCVDDVSWRVDVKDDNCNMAAKVSDDQRSISITWDTSLKSKYDDMSRDELFDLNYHGNWATSMNLSRPTPVHPVKCTADLAKLATDAGLVKSAVDAITSTCDKTHSETCVDNIEALLGVVDESLEDATVAFDDCSDGTDSVCNSDVEGVLSALEQTSTEIQEALEKCQAKELKECVKDVIESGKVAVEAVKSVFKAIKDCKGDN